MADRTRPLGLDRDHRRTMLINAWATFPSAPVCARASTALNLDRSGPCIIAVPWRLAHFVMTWQSWTDNIREGVLFFAWGVAYPRRPGCPIGENSCCAC